MRKTSVILFLCFFSVQSFAQWKSYYPESKTNKKESEKKNKETSKHMFDSHFFTALKAKSLEDFDVALKHFEKCIKLDDKNAIPFYEVALINARNGSYDLATEQINIAVKLDSKNRWYALSYAEILFSNQDFTNSAIQYKKLITLEPGNEELYFMLADIYIYANDFRKAIGVYDDLEKHKGVDKMLCMQKHKLYRETNDMKGAIKELESILNSFPEDIEAMEILSELYLLNDEKERNGKSELYIKEKSLKFEAD